MKATPAVGRPPERNAAPTGSTSARLERLRAGMLKCRRCESLVRCRSRVVPGAGAAPARLVVVGIAPGRLGGDRTGVPFTGDRSGALLRRMLTDCGLESVFVTNLVRCNPRDWRGRNRDPSAREIANCRSHLEAELALADAPVVAALGRMAWRNLAGDAKFDPRRPRPVMNAGRIVYPMYHPAWVNRGAYRESAYRRDFLRLSGLVRRAALARGRSIDLNDRGRDSHPRWT